MKTLKLDHHLAKLVLDGKKTSTWRLFDDKDIAVNDTVELIDKVDPADRASWQVIGVAKVNEVLQKRLGDIDESDMDCHEQFASRDDMLAAYQRYYGPTVSWSTPVKIIRFNFTALPEPPLNTPTKLASPVEKVVIYADGGSRGNPGPSATGYVVYDGQGLILAKDGSYLGVTTNNQAEYMALKLALQKAQLLGAHDVEVFMDSTLVVNQMKGVFKVKNRDLWPIHGAVKELCALFNHVTFTQIPREMNKAADALVNEALDRQQVVATEAEA